MWFHFISRWFLKDRCFLKHMLAAENLVEHVDGAVPYCSHASVMHVSEDLVHNVGC